MMHTIFWSDEHLNAFIDDELDLADRNNLLEAIEKDTSLRHRLCETQGVKRLLQHAYSDLNSHPAQTAKRRWKRGYTQSLMAASFLLLIGASSGWLLSLTEQHHAGSVSPRLTRLISTISNDNVAQEPDKVIVQVSSANPVRLQAALDETENLLVAYRKNNRPLQMEILANGSGLNLMMTGATPFEHRIEQMKARFPNLLLFACQQTMQEMEARGIPVHLIPNTQIAGSALEEISRRVREGWDYVRT